MSIASDCDLNQADSLLFKYFFVVIVFIYTLFDKHR